MTAAIHGGVTLSHAEIANLVADGEFHTVGFRSRRVNSQGDPVQPNLRLIHKKRWIPQNHARYEMPPDEFTMWLDRLGLKIILAPNGIYAKTVYASRDVARARRG